MMPALTAVRTAKPFFVMVVSSCFLLGDFIVRHLPSTIEAHLFERNCHHVEKIPAISAGAPAQLRS
jgi:hypothetical protein